MAADLYHRHKVDVFMGPACSIGKSRTHFFLKNICFLLLTSGICSCAFLHFLAMEDVAKLASVWNLPIFGWYSMESKLSDKSWYTTLIRTYAAADKTGKEPFRLFEQTWKLWIFARNIAGCTQNHLEHPLGWKWKPWFLCMACSTLLEDCAIKGQLVSKSKDLSCSHVTFWFHISGTGEPNFTIYVENQ